MAIWFEITKNLNKEGSDNPNESFGAIKETISKVIFKGTYHEELKEEAHVILISPRHFIRLKQLSSEVVTVEGRTSSLLDVAKLAKALKVGPSNLRIYEPYWGWYSFGHKEA